MIWVCMLISLVLPLTQAAEQILFAGDAYSILFTEQRDSQNLANGISASIDGKALTINPSNVNGWHVELTSNNSHDSLYLKNDNVSGAITKFQLKVSYSTKEIEEVTYYVIDVQVTEDFVLPSEPDAQSFTLQCVYGNNSEFSLKELFWALETPSGYQATVAKRGAYNVNDRRVNDTITHTVAKSDSKMMYKRKSSLAAFSGVYGCHVVVMLKSEAGARPVTGAKLVVVHSKPKVGVYQSRDQFLSGETVTIECIADGYPLPNISWSFASWQKMDLKASSSPVAIEHDGEKFQIDTQYTKVGENGYNARVHSILAITNVDNKFDRGLYHCTAQNVYGQDDSYYYLRIRYYLAFLFPLVGIVIQVLLLVICLAVFKKRSKQTSPEIDNSTKIKRPRLQPEPTDSGSKGVLDARRPSRRLSNPHTDPLSLEEVEPNTVKQTESYKTGYIPHELSGIIDEEKEVKDMPSDGQPQEQTSSKDKA